MEVTFFASYFVKDNLLSVLTYSAIYYNCNNVACLSVCLSVCSVQGYGRAEMLYSPIQAGTKRS